MSMKAANPPTTYDRKISGSFGKRKYSTAFPPAPRSIVSDTTIISGASTISTRSNASDHVSSSKRSKHEGKNQRMDVLVERIRSRDPSSSVHGPIPRKAVLGATFAKSKKPASLFQGYHQRTKHVSSDFRLIPHRGSGATQDMVERCSALEANETGDTPNHAFRKLGHGTSREDSEAMLVDRYAMPLSSPAPDWLLRALSDLPSDQPKHISVKPSSIPVVPSQLQLPQTPRKEDEESVFAFAPPSLSPPPPRLASLVTSTPRPTHPRLPTLTSARSHSKCSQLSTLTTCDIPMISNHLSTSVSLPSSPFPVSPRGALLSSLQANIGQTQPLQPESPQLHEHIPPFLPYRCGQVVDTVDDPSDPDPVGRIWRQERDIAQKDQIAIPARVCKLSLLQPFRRPSAIVTQTEALPNSPTDAGPVVPKNIERLWVPSFPDAKTPNHRLADPGRSQLRRRDFLGSANPIITPQAIAAETASVKGGLVDVDVCPTTASKVKFWIPDMHSSPFSVAKSFVTVSPADIRSQAAAHLSQNVDIMVTLGKLSETPAYRERDVLDRTLEVTECRVQTSPEPSGGSQEDNLQAQEHQIYDIHKSKYGASMSASREIGPVENDLEEYWTDTAEYRDMVYTDLNSRTEWVPDFLIEEPQGCDPAAPLLLLEVDPPHGHWQQSHEDERDHTPAISERYSPAFNETKASESKSSREFDQASVDAIATMQNPRTKLHFINPQTSYPSTPDLSEVEPPKTKFKVKNVIQQTPRHNDSFESIESWGING